MRRAACVGRAELMLTPEAEAWALRECDACPVLAECRTWALTVTDVAGVCGGMTEAERDGWRARNGIDIAPARLPLPFDVQLRDLLDEGRCDEARGMLVSRGASARAVAAALGESVRTEMRRRHREATLTAALNTV